MKSWLVPLNKHFFKKQNSYEGTIFEDGPLITLPYHAMSIAAIPLYSVHLLLYKSIVYYSYDLWRPP